MYTFFHEKKNRVIYSIGLCLYISALFFVFLSLTSYNPTDNLWLYVTSETGTISNLGGFFGAQVAAILFYLFGGASFLLLLPLLFLGMIFFTQLSFRSDWERLCVSLYIVSAVAMLLATYGIDLACSPYPGGMIGLLGAEKLIHYFDPIGRMLFLYISGIASLVVLFRWSFMFVVQQCIALVARFYALIKKYHVFRRVSQVIGTCLYALCVQFPLLLAKFVQSLCDGTAFNGTGLIHPEHDEQEEYEQTLDFFTVEHKIVTFDFLVISLPAYAKGQATSIIIAPVVLSLPKNINKKIKDLSDHYADLMRDDILAQKKPATTITKKSPHYALPHMDIFIAEKQVGEDHTVEKELQNRAQVLQDKLKRFGVNGEVVAIKRGPVVTLFEYQPDVDTKLSKIIVLEDDLAMALQAMSIRIIAPIPGRSVVGFEVSNTIRHDVLFSQVTNQAAYKNFSGSLPLVLGKGTIGEVVVVDLVRMPHLLIAGSTGSGKSVALNAILISLLCKLSPDGLKLILIDPKRLEFAAFTDIAHLLFPIVTSPHQAAPVLRWVVQEMEERYEKMAQCGARNIADYNTRINQGSSSDNAQKSLPFIVVVIDELADLMITAGRDIEDLITRITQMARAAGIHMIVATQRPSVDVITGLIKANFPSRISFRVASRIDSRTILDTMGADRLLGRGDMLFLDAATSQLRRVHGAYVSDQEIEQVADHIRKQRKVEYLDLHQITTSHGQDLSATDDALYKDVRSFLDEIDEISISLLQRKFRIGYNRSARIIDMLESQGLIMPQDGGKTRKVIR